jgi:hypothetical protein
VISDPNLFKFGVLSRDPKTHQAYDQAAHAYKPGYIRPERWAIQLEFVIQQSLARLEAQLRNLVRPPQDTSDDRPGRRPLHGGTHGGATNDEEFDRLSLEIQETKKFISTHNFHFRIEKVRFSSVKPGQAPRLGPPSTSPINQLKASIPVTQQGRFRLTSVVAKKSSPGVVTEKSVIISLRDILVCAIGDSYACGEGSPDVSLTPTTAMKLYASGGGLATLRKIGADFDDEITLETELAQWQEPLAHRSYHASPFLAAKAVQGVYSDLLLGCTFLSFARTGALIDHGLLQMNQFLGVERKTLRLAASSGLVIRMTNTLEDQPASLDVLLGIGQIDEMERTIGARKIDFLTISIGGNDCGWTPSFAGIVKPFWDSESSSASEVLIKVSNFIETELPAKFDALHRRLIDMAVQPRFVLLTLYPRGFFGTGTSEAPGLNRNCGIFDAVDLNPLGSGDSWFGIDDEEAIILKHLSTELNEKLSDTVVRLNQSNMRGTRNQTRTFQWVLVDHIDKDFETHGYCAEDTFFVGAEESFLKQGDWRGILHPNERGNQAYATRIAQTMRQLINADIASFKVSENPADNFHVGPSLGGGVGSVQPG